MSDHNYHEMDMVIENLWIGSLKAALDQELLRKNGIKSILSAMRGRLSIPKTFIRYQVSINDTEDEDVLVHFPKCVEWISSELQKKRSVLVHCQAGMSRSAVIVAAYLMYTNHIGVDAALALIKTVRPVTQPNNGFMTQLALFHAANYKRSRRNKEIRSFYVERAVREVTNGDGTDIETDMFAKYPRTPSDSVPTTPYPQRRRRIRCKMCRQELATREHMVDHGQVGPSTPGTAMALSPVSSRRSSVGETIVVSKATEAGDQTTVTLIRRPSNSETVRRPSFGSALAPMTPIHSVEPSKEARAPFGESGQKLRKPFAGLLMTPLSDEPALDSANEEKLPTRGLSFKGNVDLQSTSAIESDDDEAIEKSDTTGAQLSQLRISTNTPFSTPLELAAQIHPALAALRSPYGISALNTTGAAGLSVKQEDTSGNKQSVSISTTISPPLLMPNTKCSGYFVEPMKWMDPCLESGNMAGKIICPNKKCGAKLGNYDWAGVECSCKHWVVPVS
ncbi:hypothetical protein Clacol_009152 [Clathrus columnatus]|uniref:protein-tyrosine-phosphatase n=1 Tax=Clathrus columnatus TaxID=1419009 RepID=A0AAV5AMZ3_9AGAM|nr:hypothetical protein Clacol_009152 [Clathrus columnatus]